MKVKNIKAYNHIINDIPVVKSLHKEGWELSPTGICKLIYAWICNNKNDAPGNCYVKIADGDRSSIQYKGDSYYFIKGDVVVYFNEKFSEKNNINKLIHDIDAQFDTVIHIGYYFDVEGSNDMIYYPDNIQFGFHELYNAVFQQSFGDEFKNGTNYEDVYPSDGDKKYFPYAKPVPKNYIFRECNGWNISRIIDVNEPIGIEAKISKGSWRRIKDETWVNIKSDILIETGFKWDFNTNSFLLFDRDLAQNPDKDGIVDKLCEILGKYFHPKGGKQAQATTQPTPAPAAQQAAAQPMESREELEEALEFYELQASKGIIGADKKVTELKEKLNKLP